MKKIIGIICCIAMLCVQVKAQDRLELRRTFHGREFRLGADEEFEYIGPYRAYIRPILSSYEPSYKVFRKSHRMKVWGDIFSYAGLGGAAVLLVSAVAQPDHESYGPSVGRVTGVFIGASLSFLGIGIGIPCQILSGSYLRESVQLYNSQFDERLPADHMGGADIRLGITPHGLGIVMSW